MYYWKQVRYDTYRLIGGGATQDFRDYAKLYAYCVRHGIDATCV